MSKMRANARAIGLPGSWTSHSFDPQGSVAQRLNCSQAITSSSYYDEYGQEYTTGAPSDPFGYNAQSGYYVDRQTGKYLLGHRYYDWSAGRFLTRDPIGQAGGINLYGYCQSSPVGRADPSGGVPEPSYFLNWDYYRQHPLADPTKGWFGRDRFYYYTRDDGNTAIHWPGMDEPVESCGLDDDGQRGSWAILLGIGRKPTGPSWQ